MTGFSDHDPAHPDYELSQTELRSLSLSLQGELVLHGVPTEVGGEYPATRGSQKPYTFSKSLPNHLVREVFYPDDESVIVRTGGMATYMTPHRIEPIDGEPIFEDVFVVSVIQLAETDIECRQSLSIVSEDGHYSSSVRTEYMRGDERISPNMISRGGPLDDDRNIELLSDQMQLERPLTPEDVQKLHRVIAFISGA